MKPRRSKAKGSRLRRIVIATALSVIVVCVGLFMAARSDMPKSAPQPTTTPEPTPIPLTIVTETPIAAPASDDAQTATNTPEPIPSPTSAPPPSGTATAGVNLRAGPGTNYAKIGGLSEGEQIAIVGQTSDGEWYNVTRESGESAWVSAAYIATDVDRAAIPTIALEAIPATQAPTNTPIATNTPRPLPTNTMPPPPTNTPAPVCDCGGDYYNCGDFASKGAARACYRYCTGIGAGDVHKLDRDNDGLACE